MGLNPRRDSPYVMGFSMGSTIRALETCIDVAMAHSSWAWVTIKTLAIVICVHVVAAYMHVGSDLDAGVSHWYSRESWFNAYQFSIKPVFGTYMWKKTNDVPPLPPIIRKMSGRLQKKRIQAPGETSGSQCASRGGGRSGRGDGNDGSGSGSGVNDASGSGVTNGSGSGGKGGGRAGGSGKRGGGSGKRGGGRAGRGSERGSRGGEYQLELDEQAFRECMEEQAREQAKIDVEQENVADVDEAPEQETSDDGPALEQAKSPAVDKGKTKASVEDGPAPKKKRGRQSSSVDGIRIYHKNRGRSERIANMKSNKPFQFDKFGTGSTPDKAFDVE
ncbi:hypothetical protein Tco_0409181 [Tanacetum coccineum]